MTKARSLPGHRVPSLDKLSTLRSPLTLSDIKLLVREEDFSLSIESRFRFSSQFRKHCVNVMVSMEAEKNNNLRNFHGMNFAWFQKWFNMIQTHSTQNVMRSVLSSVSANTIPRCIWSPETCTLQFVPKEFYASF